MADESNHETFMSRFCWWLIYRLSRLLESDERDAVLGDFAESGQPAGRALHDLLGVIVRRQALLWVDWRPWLTFVFLIVPFGVLLSYVARRVADSSAIYLWLYANNWHSAYLSNPGFWEQFAHSAAAVFVVFLTLACWSWTTGFVLGRVSGRLRFQNTLLFCLLLFSAELLGALPGKILYPLFITARNFQGNDVVFVIPFYRGLFVPLVQIGLVAIPSIWGMRQSLRVAKLPPLVQVILWSAAVISLAATVIQNWGFAGIPYRQSGLWSGWQVQVLQVVVYWPIAYLVASMIARRRERKLITT